MTSQSTYKIPSSNLTQPFTLQHAGRVGVFFCPYTTMTLKDIACAELSIVALLPTFIKAQNVSRSS
ncbi:hypothetical protein [Rubritalea tangerina]|uniref:hypothetical protein n=1 Tax=Rubritalea tangerina TaxID=430798 RepID=UPI003615F8D6